MARGVPRLNQNLSPPCTVSVSINQTASAGSAKEVKLNVGHVFAGQPHGTRPEAFL